MSIRIRSLLCGLALLGAFVVPAMSHAASPSSIVIPVDPEPKSLNPDWQADPGSYWPSGNIYNHLVISDWGAVSGKPNYRDLAQSWKITHGGRVYTFLLRKGVTWQDGKPFSSADVVYTYRTIIAKNYPLAQYLAGATVTAPNKNTVVISFKNPNVSFIPLLAQASNWYGAILPKHLYQGTDWATSPANAHPIGTGPYKFVSWERGTQLTLAANTHYWGTKPKTSRVILRFVSDPQVALAGFDSGQYPYLDASYIDNFALIKKTMDAKGSTVVVPTPSFYDLCVYFNLHDPILKNLKVRQAIAEAIDRSALSQHAFFGLDKPNYYAGVPAIGQYLNKKAQFPHTNLSAAGKLLDTAGYPSKGGSRFSLQVTDYPEGDTDAASQVLVQQLKAVGINASYQQYDAATWLSMAHSGKFQMAVYFVRYGPDPAAYAEHFHTGGPRDFTGYSNPKVDQWLDQANKVVKPAKRALLYDNVEQQLTKDLPYISLVTTANYNFIQKGWHGFSAQKESFNKNGGWFSFVNVYHS